MCTIIGGKINYDPKLIIENKGVNYFRNIIKQLVSEIYTKGGDYIKVLIFTDKKSEKPKELYYDGKIKEVLEEALYKELLITGPKKISRSFLIFSRLTPEMELDINNEDIILQPYKTIDGNYIIAHGTIPLKDDPISKNMVDTEILKYQLNLKDSINLVETLNGKIAIIKYFPNEDKFETMNNGLGVYHYTDLNCISYFSNINYKSEHIFKIDDILPYENYSDGIPLKEKTNKRIVSLFSGGLDTLVSTHVHLIETDPKSIDLLYFDWGTNARTSEIEAGNKYIKHLDNLPNLTKINKGYEVIDVKDMFLNILKVAGLTKTRIADPDAKGLGQGEAEEAISYVPVRNSMLINLAVAWAEQKYPNEEVDIVIGANLSEGMIYADNSTSFIDAKNLEIKYIGQKTSKFNLVAPFANVTKTEMLRRAKIITDNYESISKSSNMAVPIHLAYSCYFPKKDGSACNECGSCLLRNAAIIRSGCDIDLDRKLVSVFQDDNSDNDFFKLNGVKELAIVLDNEPGIEIQNIAVPNILDLNDLNIGDIIFDSRYPSVDLEVISFNSVDKIVVTDYLKIVDSKKQDNMKLYKANEVIWLSYKN